MFINASKRALEGIHLEKHSFATFTASLHSSECGRAGAPHSELSVSTPCTSKQSLDIFTDIDEI